jgi:predicted phage-related endonuclease
MPTKIYENLEQGSDEWKAIRCGVITASIVKDLITLKTKKPADNDKSRAILWELAAQQISGHVEPQYISDAMLRGQTDEVRAKIAYAERYAPVVDVGFITNDDYGFVLGYSPDGLVGDDGLIESKSRSQKYQLQTIAADEVPEEYFLQIQTGLLVTRRKWCDFISYAGGWPMYVKRVYPCADTHALIIAAVDVAYQKISEFRQQYSQVVESNDFVLTEREIEQEIVL